MSRIASTALAFLAAAAPCRAESRDIYGIGPANGGWMVAIDEAGRGAYEDRAFERLAQSGCASIRLGFDWPSLEPEPGVYRFERMDADVRRYHDHDITIYGMIVNTPAWASPSGRTEPGYPPRADAVDAWQSFCAAIAAHYRDEIRFWEVWNEQNGYGWNRDNGFNNVEEYLPVLRAACRGLKAGHPECVVGLGGLDDADGYGRIFIERLYDADGGAFFDAVADHPYSKKGDVESTADKLRKIIAALEPHGDAARPLWLTEYGWNLRELREEERVACLHRFFEILREPEFATVRSAHYIGISDFETPLDDYAVCDVNLRPRPLFHAFQEEAARVREGLPIRFEWRDAGPGVVRFRWQTRTPYRQRLALTAEGADTILVDGSVETAVHETEATGLRPGAVYRAEVRPANGAGPRWASSYRVRPAATALVNPGFEGVFPDGMAEGWTIRGRGVAKAVTDEKPDEVRDGVRAQLIALPSGHALNDTVSQVVVAPADAGGGEGTGVLARFAAWVRCVDTDDDPAPVAMRAGIDPAPGWVPDPGPSTVWSSAAPGDGAWHRVAVEAPVPPGAPLRAVVEVKAERAGGRQYFFLDAAELSFTAEP